MASRSLEPARAEMQRMVERMAGAWMRGDIAAIVELFAPDGVFVSPGGVARGHAQIAAAARSFFDSTQLISIEIRRVLVDGNLGVAEWSWQETLHGAPDQRVMEDAIVFEVRDDKLVYWREYFDPGQTYPLEPQATRP